jgi:hypothetical protein
VVAVVVEVIRQIMLEPTEVQVVAEVVIILIQVAREIHLLLVLLKDKMVEEEVVQVLVQVAVVEVPYVQEHKEMILLLILEVLVEMEQQH